MRPYRRCLWQDRGTCLISAVGLQQPTQALCICKAQPSSIMLIANHGGCRAHMLCWKLCAGVIAAAELARVRWGDASQALKLRAAACSPEKLAAVV